MRIAIVTDIHGNLPALEFTLYDKDEMNDLNAKERKILSDMLQHELHTRKP